LTSSNFKDREVEIIHELTVKVLGHEDAIISASDILGEFDSLLALARGAGQFNWTAPRMTTENIIHIQGGRHPLQEVVVPTFISNDCYLAGGSGMDDGMQSDSGSSEKTSIARAEDPSTLILTGPNHSGKSVYLKQIALIVYLSHIGSFVPADRAHIGITDRILTRVATRESVSRNESAFSIDLRQVAFAMNFATRQSLILVDEFGKGTDNTDGAGLMAALLAYITSRGADRPKLLAATHFHEIFENGFLEESPELALAHMDVRVELGAPTVEDQVTYLYQLVHGRSIASFGSRCASMNGVDEAVVERAEEIVLLQARNEDLEVACSRLSDAETRKLARAEAVARAFIQEDFELPQSAEDTPKPKPYREMLERFLSTERGNTIPDSI
jgi:DNA mismatch repair protein MSH5